MSSAVPLSMLSDRRSFVVIIGVDPHKRTHTASALEPGTHRVLATLQIDATLAGYRQLARWAARFEVRRWAVENARGLGRHLAQWLVARGEQVDDVPCTATARVRELSRGGRRKNDVIDAAAAASVAALAGDATPIPVEDLTTVLALLDERRANLAAHRTRLVNQLHALLRDLIPGGADTDLTATAATRLLAAVRPVGAVETARKQLCPRPGRRGARGRRPTQSSCPHSDRQHGRRARQPTLPRSTASARSSPPGCSAAPAAPAGSPPHRRSPSYAGVAPVEVASADRARHRLPRGGDRQLNLALHIVALTQVRMPNSIGRAYYDRKIAEGKTRNEAMRCLKRRLADHVWRVMIADERRTAGQAREDNRGRQRDPARLAQPRQPALRTSHFPDLPTTSLRPVDKHRGTPAWPETVSSDEPGGLLGSASSVERFLELGWWDVAAVLVQVAVVVPVDPLGGRELDGLDGAPWSAVTDYFGLVGAVDGFGQGVDAPIAVKRRSWWCGRRSRSGRMAAQISRARSV